MQGIKGVVIAGGTGSRLYPLTKVVNKQLMPVYDQPVVYYPIKTLMNMGIKNIMIISGPEHAGQFLELFIDNQEFKDIRFEYTIQRRPGGIAQALGLAREFVGNDRVVAILGDNIYEENFAAALADYMKQEKGGKVFLKEVIDPERFGCPVFNEDGVICKIEEKPKEPKSMFCVTGLYMYDNRVWDIIDKLQPSVRNELEITDVSNFYVYEGSMTYQDMKGFWIDAGTLPTLLKAGMWAAQKQGINLEELSQF